MRLRTGRTGLLAFLSLCLLTWTPGDSRAATDKRVAFVIGNSSYKIALVPPLPDPVDVAPAPAPAPVVNIQAEMRRAYELASQVGTKEAWDHFLTLYTTGFYAALARLSRDKIIAEEARAVAAAEAAAAKLKRTRRPPR
jgi:hypothetical protein